MFWGGAEWAAPALTAPSIRPGKKMPKCETPLRFERLDVLIMAIMTDSIQYRTIERYQILTARL